MTIPSIATLNTGPDFHLLDHIAPLAWHLQAPLIVTEELNYRLALKYYPHVKTEYVENLESDLRSLTRFDALIECKYWLPHLKTLFSQIYGKKMDLVFCPHGQSDKGFGAPLLAPYAQQDAVLLYGDLLIEMLQSLDVWPSIGRSARIGDHRTEHYLRHKKFYDTAAETDIFSRLPKNRPTLLYAPTWRDADQSTLFFDQGATLLAQLPQDWNLIVKVHPLLKQREPAHYEGTLKYFDRKSNALLVEDFPPVHPILSRIDAYLGDFSSVGYDFLQFKRPMFFFSEVKGRLSTCGLHLDRHFPIFSFIEKHLDSRFTQKQEDLYRYAFGCPLNIRDEIHKLLVRC